MTLLCFFFTCTIGCICYKNKNDSQLPSNKVGYISAAKTVLDKMYRIKKFFIKCDFWSTLTVSTD